MIDIEAIRKRVENDDYSYRPGLGERPLPYKDAVALLARVDELEKENSRLSAANKQKWYDGYNACLEDEGYALP